MSGPLCEDEILSGACGPDLLHLLTCPACRAWAIGRLLDEAGRREEDEEETREDYDAIFESLLAPGPEAVEVALRRRREAERLLGELMRLPAKRRLRGLREERFRSLDLLDHLLEASHAGQLAHPEEAGHVLASVGPKLAEEGSLAEAVLVSLDLALTLAEEGRSGEIGKLAAGLPPAFPGASKAVESLHALAALAERRDPGLREAAARARSGLLRMFRLGGLWVRPLPFA